MKKLLVIGLALVLVLGLSGFALADNTIDIDQTSSHGAANPNTGLYNNAWVEQGGPGSYDQDVDIDQIAGDYNTVHVWQHGHSATYGNKIKVDQRAGTYNVAYVVQKYGQHNKVDFYQDAFTDNYARINQTDGGMYNILVGALSDGTINLGAAATQISSGSRNWLDTVQGAFNNQIGLYQSAFGDNYAYINQSGSNNSLGVYQTNSDGSNHLTSYQTGDMWARVTQSTVIGDGIITINQN